MKSASRALLVPGAFLLACVSAGCAALDFDRDFDVAVAHGSLDDYTGPWEGRWQSDVDGHDGSLRCIVKETGLNEYSGQFKAIYGGIFPFVYTTPMRGAPDGGVMRFTGSTDLPGYGTYNWTGQMSKTEFTAEYRTKKDHGTFKMIRPGGGPMTR